MTTNYVATLARRPTTTDEIDLMKRHREMCEREAAFQSRRQGATK